MQLAAAVSLTSGSLITAAPLLLFQPHARLKTHIKSATSGLLGYLDEMSIRGPKSVSDAGFYDPLHELVYKARLQGYTDAGLYPSSAYKSSLKKIAHKRATGVSQSMARVSRKHINQNQGFMFGIDRAERAARYEASRAYFRGVKDALGGDSELQKHWITTSAEPCEDCQDNEDSGPVGIDEPFESGDEWPPLHLHCQCYVGVAK